MLANQDLTIFGNGFTGGGCILEGDITFNGVPLAIDGDTDCPGSIRENNGDRKGIEITSGGNFTVTVRLHEPGGGRRVPSSLMTKGTHLLKVVDTSGTEGAIGLTVPERTVTVTPASARPREEVTVSGRNFIADNPDGARVEVRVTYACGRGLDGYSLPARLDSTGAFSTAVFSSPLLVPSNCALPSSNRITVEIFRQRPDHGHNRDSHPRGACARGHRTAGAPPRPEPASA